MMTTRAIVEKAEKKPLGFPDLKQMLGPSLSFTKLIDYDQLKAFQSLDQLFAQHKAIIILMQIENPNAPKVGHWISLLNKPNLVEHFDPYGFSIDQELAITHEQNLLGDLFSRSQKPVRQSKRRFQQLREGVNTCGRWAVVRVRNFDKSLPEFSAFIDSVHFEPDVAVTLMTLHL